MPDTNWVNDEFEIGFNEPFERSWRRVEGIGRVVMIVFVGAALAGLLGHGPFSHRRATNSDGSLAVDYEPVARFGTETQVTFHLLRLPTGATQANLTLSNGFGEPFGLAGLDPKPLRSIIGRNGITMIFPVRPGEGGGLVRMKGTPSQTGPITLSAQLDGDPAVSWTHFVVP